jgi:alanine-glyoxylate transaminase/serine-glyoxylate transaminase/serine-pyruvate transaminase
MISPPNLQTIEIKQKTLLGPGPCNVHERVRSVMGNTLLGHMDSDFLNMMEQVKKYLQYTWQTNNEFTLPISGTGSAAMEACAANLVEEGDKILVCINGYFGLRFKEMCERNNGNVITLEQTWGKIFTDEQIKNAIDEHSPDLLFIVHAETSTGVLQPIENIGQMCKENDILFCVDTVTSIGGVELFLDKWNIDACYAGTQKCLNAPPGLAPISFSQKARDKMNKRDKIQNWYLDLRLIEKYLVPCENAKRSYHHTAPISMIYACHEALKIIAEETLEERWKRHRETAEYFWTKLNEIGLECLVDKEYRLPSLTTVKIPLNVDGVKVCKYLMKNHNVEIAGGLGELSGKVWRIGLMGMNSTKSMVDKLIPLLDEAIKNTKN